MASRLMPFLLLLVFISSLVFLTGPKSSATRWKCRMQPSKGPRQFKHSRIVQADAAGQGNPDRLQCTDAATKTPSGSSCFQKGTKNVAFVSLFVPPGPARDNPCDESVVGGGRVLRAFDKPFAVLDVFVESIRLAMPYSEQIIVTDPNAEFSDGKLPEGVTVERFSGNYSRANLMLQRLESYVAFLELKLRHQEQVGIIKHLIFTDSDIIILRDLGCVFVENPSFDVGLTFRNNKEQPINSGVIFVRGTKESLMKGKLFMQEVLTSYKKNFMRAARMMGDQLAFAQVVKTFSDSVNEQFRQGKLFEANVKGVNVLFLPCSLYNWTPAEGAGQFHGMPLEVKVIHFKGSRKRLMIEAWRLHKQRAAPDEDLAEMKCFVLRSGRAKYDF